METTGPRPSLPDGWDQTRVPRWFPRAVLYVLVGVAAFLALRQIVDQLSDLLIILLVSLFASFAVEPAVDWLADRGWRRGAATGLVFFVIAVVGGLLVYLMVNLVVQQVSTLVGDAPRLIRNATKWINKRFDAKITADSIVRQLKQYQGNLASTAGDVGGRVVSVTGSVLGAVFQGLTVALFSFYFVADGPKLRRTICSVLPPERQRMVLALWEIAISKTGGYLYSRTVLAAVSAAGSAIAFTVIGVPSPVALAMWMGVVSQFVPVIGSYIGGALPVLIALLNDPIDALWVLIFLIVYQQLENYLLSPRITARTMNIHPAVAFGAAFGGVAVIGPIGALLALPAAAIVQAFVSSYLHRYEVIAHDLDLGEPTTDPVAESDAMLDAVSDADADAAPDPSASE